MQANKLLLVQNVTDAVAVAGGNLLAAPGWCVVCADQSQDPVVFHKAMSRMGVFDAYIGFDDVLPVLKDLAWCLVATTQAEWKATYEPMFDTRIYVVEPDPVDTLSAKLNRKKTVDLTWLESHLPTEAALKTEPLTQTSSHPRVAEVLAAFEDTAVAVGEFKVADILRGLHAGQTVVYLPASAEDRFVNRLIQLAGPEEAKRRIDFLFVDARLVQRTLVPADQQYMYEFDVAQPMVFRPHNYVLRTLVALLETAEDMTDLFGGAGYQFLSRLRMVELRPRLTQGGATAIATANATAATEDWMEQDIADLMYMPVPTHGGAQRRRKTPRNRNAVKKLKRRYTPRRVR